MSKKQATDINIDSSDLIQNKYIQKQNQFARFTFYSLKAHQEGQNRAHLD